MNKEILRKCAFCGDTYLEKKKMGMKIYGRISCPKCKGIMKKIKEYGMVSK